MNIREETVVEMLERFYRLYPPVRPITGDGDCLIDEWRQALASLTDIEARDAANLYIKIGVVFPTPADLLRCANTIRAVTSILVEARHVK